MKAVNLACLGVLVGAVYTCGCGSAGASPGPSDAGADVADASTVDAVAGDGGDTDAGVCPPPREATNDGGCVGVTAAGWRTLAMEIDSPMGLDYATEVDVAIGIGVKAVPITLPWSLLEKSPMAIDTTWFQALNAVYATRAVALLLSIPLVDTVSVKAPTDLAPQLTSGSLAFDDPSVISRYEALLDGLFATLDPKVELRYLLVANEENIFLAGKPDAMWNGLAKFYAAIKAYAVTKRSGIVVGMNVAFVGLIDPAEQPKVQALTAAADQVFVSYYLGDNGFGHASSTAVPADIDTMIAFAGTRPLVLKEFGYATGTTSHTTDGQMAFITDLFQAWDAHASQIPMAVISRMFDGSPPDCAAEAQAYGQGGNQDFIAFLCTLGVRSYADAPKVGWSRLVDAAKLRGF